MVTMTVDRRSRTFDSVKREIRRRAGDRCEYPDCWERVHLEFAHRQPHHLGSGREARDLLLLCREHHFLQEIRFRSARRTIRSGST